MAPNLDLCRLCAQKKKIKLDLFCGNRILLQKIVNCLSINITAEDMLPKMVCCECQRNVEQLNNFKLNCLKAEEKLNKILNGLSCGKPLPCVKEEVGEPEQRTQPCPTTEHNYFTVLLPQSATSNVKREVTEEELFLSVPSSQDETNEPEVIFEDFVFERTSLDVKQPIIEVVVDNNYEQIIDSNENTNSKAEIDVINYEPKPVVEIAIDDNPMVIPDNAGGIKAVINEFSDKDLMLDVGEICDVDMEEMEATIMKKSNPEMRFKCSDCETSFKFFKALKKHRRIHDIEENTYVCHLCVTQKFNSYEFATLASLKSHIFSTHLKKDVYSCKSCSEQFRTRSLHKNHVKIHHSRPIYKCSDCSKIFKTKSILSSHMRVHSDYKPYVCEQCGAKFKWPGTLQYHLQMHKKEKNYLCAECGNKFSSKRSMLEHFNVHSGEKPHTCTECALSFSHISSLRKHEALHKTLRYRCNLCGRRFSLPFLLKQHETCHTGVRLFSCHICNMKFRTQANLCNHRKVHGEKRFECNICKMKFARSHQLRDHMGRHTGSKHICPAPGCRKTYTQRFPLSQHFRKHHPNMEIINKRGGRRKAEVKSEVLSTDGICYGFRYKTDVEIVYCAT